MATGRMLASHRSSIGWALVTAVGLIIALAGVTISPESQDTAATGARLALHLPETVALAVTAMFSLAALLLLVLLRPRELPRRRKKGDEEFELYHEPVKVPRSVGLLLLALMLLPLAGIGWLLWSGGPPLTHDARPVSPPAARSPSPAPPGEQGAMGAQKPTVSVRPFDVAVAVLATVAGLATLGLMAWLAFGDRLTRWWARRIFDDTEGPLRQAVAESVDDLNAEPDVRMAIIKCYGRFEQALADARAPRAPWQTPTEFMRFVLGRLTLPREAVMLLTGLFELACFSARPLGGTERDAACDCLAEIGTAPEERRDAAATA